MRVALLVPSILKGKGGAEKVATQVANLIQAQGGHATVIGTPQKGRTPSYPLADGVDLLQIAPGDTESFRSGRGEFDLMVGFAMSDMFAKIPVIAQLLDVPFVIQECTNPFRMVSILHTRRQDGCTSLDEAFWLRQAVFAHASAIRFTVPAYAATVVPPISPFTYAFYNSLSQIGDRAVEDVSGRHKIVCVGTMKNLNKNGMDAVRGFVGFAEANPGWSLHLYGKNAFAEELQDLLRRNPDADVHDHGLVDDIETIYADASLLVIPSFEEGLPNVVVEAFSYGVPCIGYSDCLGVNHLIEDGVRGRLVPRKPGAIAAALTEFARDEALHQHCIGNCLEFAQRNFPMERFEKNWLTLLDNALAGRDNGARPTSRVVDVPGPAATNFRHLLKSVPSYGD